MNEEELIQRTRELIGRWDNVRIVGQGWAGDARRGFQFNPIASRSGGTTTPVTTGACCPVVGSCFVTTQAICEASGGTYQGDGTPCVPDPCNPCPTPITVQFSGIIFNCGCSQFNKGSAGSFLITDEGDANSFITSMNLGRIGSSCGDCGGLKWFSGSGEGLSPHVLISYWNEDSECSGPETGTDFPEYFGMIMVLLSGTYYLVAYINFNLIFYGSTTDLNIPITNTLSCDLGFHDYSGDPAIDCLFNGVLTPNLNSIANGGTATITV